MFERISKLFVHIPEPSSSQVAAVEHNVQAARELWAGYQRSQSSMDTLGNTHLRNAAARHTQEAMMVIPLETVIHALGDQAEIAVENLPTAAGTATRYTALGVSAPHHKGGITGAEAAIALGLDSNLGQEILHRHASRIAYQEQARPERPPLPVIGGRILAKFGIYDRLEANRGYDHERARVRTEELVQEVKRGVISTKEVILDNAVLPNSRMSPHTKAQIQMEESGARDQHAADMQRISEEMEACKQVIVRVLDGGRQVREVKYNDRQTLRMEARINADYARAINAPFGGIRCTEGGVPVSSAGRVDVVEHPSYSAGGVQYSIGGKQVSAAEFTARTGKG